MRYRRFWERFGAFTMEISICREGGDYSTTMTLHSFPMVAFLADATDEELRGMGLGCRSEFVIDTQE